MFTNMKNQRCCILFMMCDLLTTEDDNHEETLDQYVDHFTEL